MTKSKRLITLALVVCLGFGVWTAYRVMVEPKTPAFPDISDVESLEFHIWVLQPDRDPEPLYTKNAADEAIIEKVIGYLHAAKSEGFDDKVPSESAPSDFAFIKLKNGEEIRLDSAGNDRVYALFTSNGKTIRVLSPELSNWLDSGWKKDFTSL